MPNLNYDFLECAAFMPPLSHKSQNDDEFDIRHSEAAKWLCQQPEVMQKIFDKAKQKKLIVYDSQSKTWVGANYHD